MFSVQKKSKRKEKECMVAKLEMPGFENELDITQDPLTLATMTFLKVVCMYVCVCWGVWLGNFNLLEF